MKILTIPDLHGRDIWQEFIKIDHDLTLFLGDYVDSYDISTDTIIGNLQDVIMYKKENLDKVVLLLGNHDGHYLYYPEYRCSGFKEERYRIFQEIFYSERDLFKIAYQPNKEWIFTHAGISLNWYNKYYNRLKLWADEMDTNLIDCLADVLNAINNSPEQWILHEVGVRRGGMRGDYGGPTWADITELEAGLLPYKHQVVGHNRIEKPLKIEGPNTSTSCTLIDTLGHYNEPFIIEI